jgi:site-specific DNA-cytosine methylase
MLKTSESPSEGDACSLSGILEPSVPQRFYLSARAASGILRRAARREKVLPAELHQALESLASESMQSQNTIRRLTPTETERLMGYPDGWTISHSWQRRRHSGSTK